MEGTEWHRLQWTQNSRQGWPTAWDRSPQHQWQLAGGTSRARARVLETYANLVP